MIGRLSLTVWILAASLHAGEESGSGKEPPRKENEPRQEGGEGTTTTDNLPPLEKLLELNSAAIFGGKVKLNGSLFEVVFDTDGEVQSGFEGNGIIDSKSQQMTGSNRNFIVQEKKDGVEKLIPGLAAVGMGEGHWVSRFPVKGKTWVEFGFRVPNLITQESSFRLRVNWEKGVGYETSFFQSIAFVAGGVPKTNVMTDIKEYRRAPSRWFPRKKESVKVEYGIREGSCVVRMNGKEMVSVPKVADKGGRVSIAYRKLLFTIDSMKISGELDRAWCEKRIAELQKEGKLKVAEGGEGK
jgi:hypothetical protein